MSGVQGGRCHFDSQMISLMNFERPTECRYYMPYVVGYVVAYVVRHSGPFRIREKVS
jgi:hypothetical protein